MSQYFQVGDRVLWNPATRVAQAFRGMADALVPLAGVPHGMGPMVDDECDIDPVAFDAFVRALVLRYRTSGHHVMSTLIYGFVCIALVLAEWALSGEETERLSLVPRTDWAEPPSGGGETPRG